MAELTVEDAPIGGLDDVTFVAASVGGDTVPTGPRVLLLVRNTGAGAITATVATPVTEGGLAVEDPAVTVPATTGMGIVPMVHRYFGALASVTYSSATDVDVAAVRLRQE